MKNFMPDMHDHELDSLFRKAAEKYSPAHKEEVWKKLESKLEGKSGKRRPLAGWWKLLILFLLMGTAGYFIWGYGDTENGMEKQLSFISPEENNKNDQPAITNNIMEKGNDWEKDISVPPQTLSQQEQSHSTTEVIPGSKPASDETSAQNLPDKNILQPEKLPVTEIDKDQKMSVTGISGKVKSARVEAPPIDLKDAPVETNPVFHPKKSKTQTAQSLPYADGGTPITKKQITRKKSSDSLKKLSNPDNDSTGVRNPWGIGFTVGPEWNGVSGSSWDIGLSGGLKLTYRVNEKWALATGALVSRKMYKAKPGDYNPVDDYWTSYDVRNIDAECVIWDIPLNVEYTIWKDQRNAVYLGTGISSIWMPEEKYTYFYKTSSGSWDQWTKEVYGQNHHIFSILNISAGYTHSWKRFSLQATPYLKVPLKGIGYGRVKLYSAGIHFTIQYDGLR